MAIGEKDFRMRSARVKAVSLDSVCTACENCHMQLSDLVGHYKVNASVRFLTDMVADSLQA